MIRRAAERKAIKLARKSAQPAAPADNPPAHQTQFHLPEDSLQAAQDATPADSSLTAVTSALTGHTIVLPAADAPLYRRLLSGYQKKFQPVGFEEATLVQSLADTAWRARRLPALELAIFAKGRIEFAEQYAEQDAELRVALIDLETFLTYEKHIRALQLQEGRLARRAEKESAELRRLQLERTQQEAAAAAAQPVIQTAPRSLPPQQTGFEFSNREMQPYSVAIHGEKQDEKHPFPAPHIPETLAEAA